MVRRVTSPDGLEWTVKRRVVPTGFLPLTRTDLLHEATPRRTRVEGMDRQVPDAIGASTGPLPLGFLFTPLVLPLLPFVLLLRRLRVLPWTVEGRTYPWGHRYPPAVLAYAIRGGEESRAAVRELVEALSRGEGTPRLRNAEQIRQQASPHSGAPIVGTKVPSRF